MIEFDSERAEQYYFIDFQYISSKLCFVTSDLSLNSPLHAHYTVCEREHQ